MRLTIAMKDQIVNRVMSDTIYKKRDELNIKEKLLGDSLVSSLYAPYQEAIAKLPSTAFRKSTEIRVQFTSKAHTTTSSTYITTKEYKSFYNQLQFETDNKSEVAEMIYAIRNSRRNLEEQEKQLRKDLQQVLNSVTTVKRLYDIWPEGKQWTDAVFTAFAAAEKAKLPMVTTDNLNKKLCILLNDPKSLPCKGA